MAELLRTESGDKRHFYLLLNKSTVLRIRTFFFFPPLVQSRQFRNSYWPAYQNSPSGNFRYWLLRINVFYFIYYHFIFSRWTQDDQRRTLARFGAFVCQERGGRRLINEQLTVSLVSVVRDSTIAR